MSIDITRLKVQLNQTLLVKDNPPLFQLLKQLIDVVEELIPTVNTEEMIIAGTLQGRRSTSNGPLETIKLGTGISMTGDTINVP